MKRGIAAAALAAGFALAPLPAAAEPPGADGAFTFRFGWFFPSGGGDFWAANEEAFTLDRSDFNAPIGGVGYTAAVNNYFEIGFNVDFYSASDTSADRYYTDQFGNPILHDTRLGEAPLTVDFKVLPTGRFARRGPDGKHLVRHPVPYLGAGIGMVYWQYEEEGDFVATDLSIVYDQLTDSGVAFETHVLAGIEFPVAPNWGITLEGRYSWAETSMGGPFTVVNPNDLDLGGVSVFVGGALRF